MIVEIVTVLAIFVGGCGLLRTAGVTGWALPGLGYLAGLCGYLAIGTLLVIARVPAAPTIAVVLTAVLPVTWWAVRRVRCHAVSVPVRQVLLALPALVVLVLTFRAANLVSWHSDSFKYLITASMLASDTFHDGVTKNLLSKRLLAVPLIHAPAGLAGEYYLPSVVPLLAISGLVALVWLFRLGSRVDLGPVRLVAFAALGVLLLLTNNRFVFNAFYLNGHLLFGVLVLVLAGCGWLLASRTTPAPAWQVLQLLAIPALVVTRPEGSLVAALVLLPMLLSGRVPLRHRTTAAAVLGGSLVTWHGFVTLTFLGIDGTLADSALPQLLLGVLILALLPLLRWRHSWQHRTAMLVLVEAGLWLALLAFAVRQPGVLKDSVRATVHNVVLGEGSWGLSLVILGGLVLLAMLLAPAGESLIQLRFPLTTFVPLAFLLAYLREGAYRIGDGDSLNRMLIQLVPLAVLYVVVVFANRQAGCHRAHAGTTAG